MHMHQAHALSHTHLCTGMRAHAYTAHTHTQMRALAHTPIIHLL